MDLSQPLMDLSLATQESAGSHAAALRAWLVGQSARGDAVRVMGSSKGDSSALYDAGHSGAADLRNSRIWPVAEACDHSWTASQIGL